MRFRRRWRRRSATGCLNEPGEAESICLDVLEIDAGNQDALIMLILALTDQFPQESSSEDDRARRRSGDAQLVDEYDRAYYSGIVRERRAKAVLQHQQLRRHRDRDRLAQGSDGVLRDAPKPSGRRTTTTRCCAGTRARAC